MKKIIILIAALAAMVSCDKFEDTFGPSTYESSTPLELYMLSIADDGVSVVLSELETALQTDPDGVIGKYFYTNNGLPLTADDAVWTVNREGSLLGTTIKKVTGKNAWTINYEGDFSVEGASFPTAFEITATLADSEISNHMNWSVEFRGTRKEEDGYTCSFSNAEVPVDYKIIENTKSWGAYGYLLMTVFKDSKQIDRVLMELRGLRSSASITHIK